MGGMGNRRSDRISIALPMDASGIDAEDHPFIDTATTIVLIRDGSIVCAAVQDLRGAHNLETAARSDGKAKDFDGRRGKYPVRTREQRARDTALRHAADCLRARGLGG